MSNQRTGLSGIIDLAPWRTSSPPRSATSGWMRRLVPVDGPLPWWVLVFAALIPILLTAGWLIAGAVQPPPYDAVRQTISTLAANGGPHRWIVTTALIALGPCYFAVATGLTVLGPAARIGLLISGVAAIGIALNPEPAVGNSGRHMTCTVIGAASIAVWPLLTAQRHNPMAALVSVPVAFAVTAVFLAMVGWLLVEAQTSGAVGLVERLDSSVQITWPFVVALAVRTARRSEFAETEPLSLEMSDVASRRQLAD